LGHEFAMRCPPPRYTGGDALLDALAPRGGEAEGPRKDLLAETGGVGARGGDELLEILMLVVGGGEVVRVRVRGGEGGALDGAGAALFAAASCASWCVRGMCVGMRKG
jgi:hypothetical protein